MRPGSTPGLGLQFWLVIVLNFHFLTKMVSITPRFQLHVLVELMYLYVGKKPDEIESAGGKTSVICWSKCQWWPRTTALQKLHVHVWQAQFSSWLLSPQNAGARTALTGYGTKPDNCLTATNAYMTAVNEVNLQYISNGLHMYIIYGTWNTNRKLQPIKQHQYQRPWVMLMVNPAVTMPFSSSFQDTVASS